MATAKRKEDTVENRRSKLRHGTPSGKGDAIRTRRGVAGVLDRSLNLGESKLVKETRVDALVIGSEEARAVNTTGPVRALSPNLGPKGSSNSRAVAI